MRHIPFSAFLTFIVLILTCRPLWAGTVTLTSYYPSPSGAYDAISVDKLGVGDNDGSTTVNAGDAPATSGFAIIKNRLGINTNAPAQALDVNGNTNLRGNLYYNGTQAMIMGGMFSTGTGTFVSRNNVLTGGQSCPAGFTAFVLASGSYLDTGSNPATFSIFYCGK